MKDSSVTVFRILIMYIGAIFLILEIFKEFVLDLLLEAVDMPCLVASSYMVKPWGGGSLRLKPNHLTSARNLNSDSSCASNQLVPT